jgi:hypothetical protein
MPSAESVRVAQDHVVWAVLSGMSRTQILDSVGLHHHRMQGVSPREIVVMLAMIYENLGRRGDRKS